MKRPTLLLAALAASVSLVSLNADIKVQSDRWMPLNAAPTEEPTGYAVELLVHVFADTDPVAYRLTPWQESISNVTKGAADCLIGAAKDEAPNLIFPSEPIAHVDYGLFAPKDSTFEYSAEGIKTARIGVIKGYTYWPALDDLIKAGAPNVTIYGGDNALADAITALHEGRIDLFPESKPVFAWAVKEQELDPDGYVSKHSEDGGLIYVAFANNERGKGLAARWDEQIKRLRKAGQLADILARYNVSDWSHN